MQLGVKELCSLSGTPSAKFNGINGYAVNKTFFVPPYSCHQATQFPSKLFSVSWVSFWGTVFFVIIIC